tara:strand:- start:401 stop:538 length:138 start_codon:yes stop_codon:yes gene_type:complete
MDDAVEIDAVEIDPSKRNSIPSKIKKVRVNVLYFAPLQFSDRNGT